MDVTQLNTELLRTRQLLRDAEEKHRRSLQDSAESEATRLRQHELEEQNAFLKAQLSALSTSKSEFSSVDDTTLDRLDEKNREIEMLQRTIKELQEEKETLAGQLQDVQADCEQLRNQFIESRAREGELAQFEGEFMKVKAQVELIRELLLPGR